MFLCRRRRVKWKQTRRFLSISSDKRSDPRNVFGRKFSLRLYGLVVTIRNSGNMHRRDVSPAVSENEFDISKSLFGDIDTDTDVGAGPSKPSKPGPAETIPLVDGEDSEDDAAYIAAQQAASNRKTTSVTGKTTKKGGGFQSMGLNANLLKAITKKGFSVPTPIQRKTIPLIMDGQDVVGMARTGSGKTAAFVIPMLEKLKAHSAKVGARAVIMSPSRELALQTLKVVKDMGRGTDLRTILLVGGDSLEDQFSSMASNPDIIIATPGRFEHLMVEMRLELSSVRYVVFDEADRLFEMGFAGQLAEIIHALPISRQTLLFSATLPKSLVEFARAGLQDPKLIRLDAESKVSPDLESAYFTVNSQEKEGALLHILRDVIKVPTGPTKAALAAKEKENSQSKKRKRGAEDGGSADSPTEHSTIIFGATKHHVEYLSNLLRHIGYATSYVYGSLDQTARMMQVQQFRTGLTNLLVVTDVAARGIDIPILANVINYDFPAQPKIFVHRVGRTARAGRKGWSYSLLATKDLPYLLDLQMFLDRRMIVGRESPVAPNYAETLAVGGLVRERLEAACEEVGKLIEDDIDLAAQRDVAGKGEKQYLRTRNSASAESVKRAKALTTSPHYKETHMLFENDSKAGQELAREQMLARVSGFRPTETVFEIGKRGTVSEAADIMRKRRSKIQPRRQTVTQDEADEDESSIVTPAAIVEDDDDLPSDPVEVNMDAASDDDVEVTFSQSTSSNQKGGRNAWQDSDHFMAYAPQGTNVAEDRGYGVHSGSYNDSRGSTTFVQAAKDATMDLNNDESKSFSEASKPRGLRWDKKSKKYVARANDEDGSKGAKMMRGESGLKIAASLRSGRFDAWKKANRIDVLPRVGEAEKPSAHWRNAPKKYKHRSDKAPKELDKYRDDYYKKKKKIDEAKKEGTGRPPPRGGKGPKTEVRGIDDVRKQRGLQQKRKEKNARPSRKRG